MKKVFSVLILLFPWFIRKFYYVKILKYSLGKNSYIGISIIFVKKLELDENAIIGHFNVCKEIDLIKLGKNSNIGNFNWITGFPSGTKSLHFKFEDKRIPSLIIGSESAVTSRHMIDCTNSILIGDYTTVAGIQSQFLTHSIDIEKSIQSSNQIIIGNYCFIGTNCVLLKGSSIPSFSVIGAKSLVNKSFKDTYTLYAGTPAKKIKELDSTCKYFKRTKGYVF